MTGATVTDNFAAELTNVSWTCVAAGGASCGAANGTGDISETVNVPVGGTVTYTVDADVLSSATGNLVNTATIAVPGGVTDPAAGNDSATVTIDDNDSMLQERPISSEAAIQLQARVSLNGSPAALPGDWQSDSKSVERATASLVVLEIDQQVE